jgi:hypothetical protein
MRSAAVSLRYSNPRPTAGGKKSAARGLPLAAIGLDYNRICSLPETSSTKLDY